MSKRKQYVGRIYLGRDADGKQTFDWVGRFTTRRERDAAVARRRVELENAKSTSDLTCDQWADRWLARYHRDRKGSSYDTAKASLKQFRADFGHRPIASITRLEAMDWADRVSASKVPIVVTLFNAAVDAEVVDRSVFRGLGRRTKGRADEPPPTLEQLDDLLAACSALDTETVRYGDQMRAMLTFAAYTGIRPGELYALEWGDIDFKAMRIRVARRLYRGQLDLPKSGKVRTVALTPPARDAILGLTSRADGHLVFRSKRGLRLSQATMSGYWGKVLARAGLDFDFYLATKHYAVHYMYVALGLSRRAIAEQMGWTPAGVDKLLAVYGHGDIGALDEVDQAFADNVVELKPRAVGER